MPYHRGASSRRASCTTAQILGPRKRPPELINHPPAHQHASQAGTSLPGTIVSPPLQAERLLVQPHDPGTHLPPPTHLTKMMRRIPWPILLLVVIDRTTEHFLSRSCHRVVPTVPIPFKMFDLAVWRCPDLTATRPSLATKMHRRILPCRTPLQMARQGSRQNLAMTWALAFCPTLSPMALQSSQKDLPSRMPRAITLCLIPKAVLRKVI